MDVYLCPYSFRDTRVQLRHQLLKMKVSLARLRKTICFTCGISWLFRDYHCFTAHYLLRNKVMPQKPCHGKNAPESAAAASHSRTKTWQTRERMSLAAAAVPVVTKKNAVEHLLVRGINFSYAVMSFAPSVPLPQVIICVLSSAVDSWL